MLIVSALILPGLSCSGATNKPYYYPVRPGTPEWATLSGLPGMIEACQIPDKTLERLTTSALIDSVLDYPLMLNIWAFNSPQQGFDSVSSYFNGFAEMFNRPDIGNELISRYQRYDPAAVSKDWSMIRQGQYTIKLGEIEIILAQKEFIGKLTEKEKRALLTEALNKYDAKLHSDLYGPLSDSSLWVAGRVLEVTQDLAFLVEINEDPDLGDFLEKGDFGFDAALETILTQSRRYLSDTY